MDLKLKGLTALVTGATTGIGRGIAELMAAEGARLAIAGRNQVGLDQVADAIAATGAERPVVIAADLTQKDAPHQVADTALSKLGGRVDILVNNAGGSRPVPQDAGEDFWEESLALNFRAARRLTERLAPAMKAARYGRIISITGAMTARATNAAGPAKSALLTWSRAQSFELAPFGITVNTIAPGRINSVQILQKLHPTEASREAYIKANIPAGYFGEPADLAVLAVFLASPLARYISGAAIPVDGGMARLA
jgi:3-oxoacyl-[acyl-carrier protein] reductase